MKNSIKRGQSQAGLSFAERKNFRPKVKRTRLLLLLALLMTAATGAWGMQIYISYPSWPTGTNVNGDGNLVLEMEASDSFENMKAKIEDKSGLNPDYMKLYFNSVEMANNETLNAKGVTSNSVLTLVYTLYNVTMKDGVKDADKWTVKVGEGQAQALPIGGLKGDGSETVTLQYNGRLKVKGVKATSDAAPAANPNAYMKWDNTKKELVATEFPAEVTTMTSPTTTWAAGTYVVEGEVTINGGISLDGNVDLIIKDGAKLTVNSSINGLNQYNLSIYGQANQTGQLVVNCSNNDAIFNITTLEVHSCQVTATASVDNCCGFYNIKTFNVYGGSVDSENTGTFGDGIWLANNGSMNIYGGEVKAVGKGNVNASNGIMASSPSSVTVYGGKLWAECAGNEALQANITLAKGAGFTGKIETSDNGSSWTEHTTSDKPTTKYVRVGY